MASNSHPTEYRLGLDLGSVNVKLALCDAAGQAIHLAHRPHQGRPLAALERCLQEVIREHGAELNVLGACNF